jgi:hypothetical protein
VRLALAEGQEAARDDLAVRRQDRLRVELDAVRALVVAVADGHDLTVGVAGGHDQRLGQRLEGRQRVVAASLELRRQAFQDRVVADPADGAGLAVHQPPGRADLAALDLDQALVAEAHPEHRDPAREAADEGARDAAVRRAAGAGGDDEVGRGDGLGLLLVELVVAVDVHLGALLAQEVRQVVGERVVVVDQEDARAVLLLGPVGDDPHHRPYLPVSATSIAAASAPILFRHSWCSTAGCESATIPAPACSTATPSRMTMVRRAMQVSSAPSKPM